MNQSVVIGKLPGESDADAQKRIDAYFAQRKTDEAEKAKLLKKWGMDRR